MKIVFLSNYFNHHQKPLSEQLYERTNHQYVFIETARMDEERIKLGWGGGVRPEYVNYYWQDEETRKLCDGIILEADVVIIGSAPEVLIKKRKEQEKLVFRYSERPLKKGLELHKYLYRYIKWHKSNKKKYNLYMLCSSAYTSADYARFGLFKNQCFKWGYFPEMKKYEIADLIRKKDHKKILWVGRFLELKHADDVLRVAKKLKDAGVDFSMDFVGTGVMEKTLLDMAKTWNLQECVTFLGSMPSDHVRVLMEKAGIYLFTSDRHEGWGAVLNESMNSGCAVVASHAIGSVPFLMKHQINGFVYHSGQVDELYEKVKFLLEHPEEQERLGKAAYETITCEWNAEIAAERLISLSAHILAGDTNSDLFSMGPCSRAEIIKDSWYNE